MLSFVHLLQHNACRRCARHMKASLLQACAAHSDTTVTTVTPAPHRCLLLILGEPLLPVATIDNAFLVRSCGGIPGWFIQHCIRSQNSRRSPHCSPCSRCHPCASVFGCPASILRHRASCRHIRRSNDPSSRRATGIGTLGCLRFRRLRAVRGVGAVRVGAVDKTQSITCSRVLDGQQAAHTAVLAATSHAYCCTTLTYRPPRGRRCRFVRVVQQLACEVFDRTAVMVSFSTNSAR